MVFENKKPPCPLHRPPNVTFDKLLVSSCTFWCVPNFNHITLYLLPLTTKHKPVCLLCIDHTCSQLGCPVWHRVTSKAHHARHVLATTFMGPEVEEEAYSFWPTFASLQEAVRTNGDPFLATFAHAPSMFFIPMHDNLARKGSPTLQGARTTCHCHNLNKLQKGPRGSSALTMPCASPFLGCHVSKRKEKYLEGSDFLG